MNFFRVKNWESFQHYKNRNPPWIKLYSDLLDDYNFSCLQDASKLHLVMIWLLASRNNNKLPTSEKWIQQRIGASEKVDLSVLIESGFIEIIPNKNNEIHNVEQDAITMLAECEQNAIPEKRREENTCLESRKPKSATRKRLFSDEDLQIANEFFESLLTDNPNMKKPNLNSWADKIRLMRERDNRLVSDIRDIWYWARGDDFWSVNILSPDKLRKQFDQLAVRANQEQQVDLPEMRY